MKPLVLYLPRDVILYSYEAKYVQSIIVCGTTRAP